MSSGLQNNVIFFLTYEIIGFFMKWNTLFNIFWRNLPQVLVYNYFLVKNYYWQQSYSYHIFVVENNTGIFKTKWNIWFSNP